MEKIDIKVLVDTLNKASYAYYNTGHPIMDDAQFDIMMEQLKMAEKETGIILSNSPTHNVGTNVQDFIDKIQHNKNNPMLSLDKCHSEQELIDFAGDDSCYLSVKCDGLSTRLVYNNNGKLMSAATRGDGVTGSNVLFHVMQYDNVPLSIPYFGGLVIDGESVILRDDFEDINYQLDEDSKFKNPRNLASGTLANLDSNITKSRHMKFIAWRVINGLDGDSNFFKLKEAEKLGFTIAPMWTYSNKSTDKDNLSSMLHELKQRANEIGLPMDGAVMAKDSIELSSQMGRTDKFFRHSIAYKYEDETYPTKIIDVEWTVGKTSTLTPTAVFQPIEIDGSTVSRASLHNVSIMRELGVTKNCTAYIYKANAIIPQVKYCDNDSTEKIQPPIVCPVCGGRTEIIRENASDVLVCTNPNCQGKLLGKFTHFVSRKAMNIDGLSEATLELLTSNGLLHNFRDIYHLKKYTNEIAALPGMGAKSVKKLLESIEKSRNVKLENFLCALSIPNIGLTASKLISSVCNGDINNLFNMWNSNYNFAKIDGFGEVMANSFDKYFGNNVNEILRLADEMQFIVEAKKEIKNDFIVGKTFCVTGAFNTMKRSEIEKIITDRGGKLSGSVSKNTSYLLTNEANSGSSKAKKAAELGTPIMSEQEFLNMIGE